MSSNVSQTVHKSSKFVAPVDIVGFCLKINQSIWVAGGAFPMKSQMDTNRKTNSFYEFLRKII